MLFGAGSTVSSGAFVLVQLSARALSKFSCVLNSPFTHKTSETPSPSWPSLCDWRTTGEWAPQPSSPSLGFRDWSTDWLAVLCR